GNGHDVASIGKFALTVVNENNADTVNSGSVGWTFTLPDNDPVLQSLAVGQTITQVYTVTLDDHHGGTVTQNVTITITGTDDAPVITSAASDHEGAITEDALPGSLVASDTITFRDVDLIDT